MHLLAAALIAAAQLPSSPSPSPVVPVVPLPQGAAYSTFTAGTERTSGLFDVLTRKGAVYFDFTPAAFDRTYVIEPIVASGLLGAFTGRSFDAIPVKFVRDGTRVLWEVPNANFLTPAAAWAKLALAHSTSDSVIGFSPILAENPATKHIVFSPTLLAGDFADVTAALNPRPQPLQLLVAPAAGYALQGGDSTVTGARAYARNVEVTSTLAYAGGANPSPVIADHRGFHIGMHYSIVALPAGDGYIPRRADDRVGYFMDTLKRIDDGGDAAPYVRYIFRWDLRNKPIVYYLTNEIPPEYRPAIKRGLLAWNSAFERIGIHDAIEVRDQPNDPQWSPDDARYSTVRWITSDQPTFGAYASMISDPFTGEILHSEIVIDGEYMRAVRYGYAEEVLPALASADTLEAQSGAQAVFAQTAMQSLGTGVDGGTFSKEWLQSVVMHEAGHALGLRHNFAGSTLYSLDQIHDPAFSSRNGLSASVMDYLPVNISPPHVRQGAYFQLGLGPYDYWAIRYGYTHTDDLTALARMSSRPEYRYGTDDEASGIASIDPLIAPFDLSSDPLGYDAEQFDLTRAIISRLDARFPKNDTRYYDERVAFVSVMQNYARASLLAVRYLGGDYTSRTHRGQAGGTPPFSPVPRSTARRAFDLLAANVFAPHAFNFPSRLLRDLGPDYFHGWGDTLSSRPDFPVVAYANSIQDTVLNAMFSPVTLGRIYDAAAGAGAKDTLQLSDVFEWTRDAVFSGLDRADDMSAAHRELQRHFVDLMITYQAASSQAVANAQAPRESQALARYELERVRDTVDGALARRGLDVTARAHLEDLDARARRALNGVNVLVP